MDRRQRARELVDRIYDAVLRDGGWEMFVAELGEALDAAVVQMLNLPGLDGPRLFSVGLDPDYVAGLPEAVIEGLPFSSHDTALATDRFVNSGDVYTDVDLEKTAFYQEWMAPQKLAPVWALGHAILIRGELPGGGVSLFRARGKEPFDAADLAFCDQLVPHLARAYTFAESVEGLQRERLALAEVVDRLPTGVILLDARRQPVISNESADRIVAQDDGFKIDRNGPYAADARENAVLQGLLANALETEEGHELEATGFLSVSRPSGKRAYPLMATRLLSPPPGSQTRDAVVAIFISDPHAGQISATEGLETIYSLTHSEAELVRLLSEGHSLEEAAVARGVTVNTARSHLKHVFAKTQTSRQGELVRLVLTGVSALRRP